MHEWVIVCNLWEFGSFCWLSAIVGMVLPW